MNATIITIFLLCISFSGYSQQNNLANEVMINANFTGFHCNGTQGLCGWSKVEDESLSNATLVRNKNNTITLKIHRNKIDSNEIEQLFGEGFSSKFIDTPAFFNVQKKITVSELKVDTFTAENNRNTIATGAYPIQITTSYFIITLNTE